MVALSHCSSLRRLDKAKVSTLCNLAVFPARVLTNDDQGVYVDHGPSFGRCSVLQQGRGHAAAGTCPGPMLPLSGIVPRWHGNASWLTQYHTAYYGSTFCSTFTAAQPAHTVRTPLWLAQCAQHTGGATGSSSAGAAQAKPVGCSTSCVVPWGVTHTMIGNVCNRTDLDGSWNPGRSKLRTLKAKLCVTTPSDRL
jgi:hypothetical protein